MTTNHEYRESRTRAESALTSATKYRKKYLALRNLIREDYKSNGKIPTPEIAKAIGWKYDRIRP